MRYGTSWDEGAAGKHVSRPIPRHRLLDPKFREGFAELGKLGLTFNSWHFFPQLPDLLDLARAFPGQTIIVDHVGGHLGVGQYAGKQAETMPVWKKNMQDLAGCPNVNVKLGGLGMTSFGFDFHLRDAPPSSQELAAAWKPYIETCIELFGPDRCMFESNFPPDKQSCGYTELWNAFKHHHQGRLGRGEDGALQRHRGARVQDDQALVCGRATPVARLLMSEPEARGPEDS